VYWLSRNRLLAANVAFMIYAIALAVDTGHADRTWAMWAAVGYGVTSAFIWFTRHTKVPMLVPLLMSLAGALAAPLTWLATRVQPTPEVLVISRSATLLLQHGTPYLQQGQFAGWISYNPYLPVMAVFGLPKALGATGLLGDPRIWLAAVSLALIWLAFRIAVPHQHCEECRHHVKLSTLFVVASPVIAFPLAIGITDPPVIALMFLTLALIARPSGVFKAALALGVACAMKATAWPMLPVVSAMLATRDALRSAWRFAGLTVLVAVGLSAAMAPAALSNPPAFIQNTVLFPLGLTKHKTPAASPLPGHLLANTGMPGHWLAVGLLVAAGLGFAISLVFRPPANVRAAAWRLAWGLAVMFTLAPATRWGYFVYPLGLVAWLVLTRQPPATEPADPPVVIPVQAVGDYADDVTGEQAVAEPSLTGVRLLPPRGAPGLRADPPGFQVGALGLGEHVDGRAHGGEHEPGRLRVDVGGHLVHADGELPAVGGQPGKRERLDAERQVHHLGRMPFGGHQVHHPALREQQQGPAVAEVVGVHVRPHAAIGSDGEVCQRPHVDLGVEVPGVGQDGAVFHGLEVVGRDHVAGSGHGDEYLAERRRLGHRQHPESS
jgi:hypothetical protein